MALDFKGAKNAWNEMLNQGYAWRLIPDVLEQAIQAEQFIVDLQKSRDSLIAEIANLKQQVPNLQAAVDKMHKASAQARDDEKKLTDSQTLRMQAETKKNQDALELSQRELRNAVEERNATISKLDEQVKQRQRDLERITGEIDKLKKRFAA